MRPAEARASKNVDFRTIFLFFLVQDLVNPASTVDPTMLSVFLEGVNIHQKHILLIKNLNASPNTCFKIYFSDIIDYLSDILL